MNRKTTLLSLKCLIVIAFTNVVNAQQIYTNGPLSSAATSLGGTAAPAGYTWSEVQSLPGVTDGSNTNAGYGALFNTAGTTNLQLADDFIVPTGQTWNVTSFDFYCYKTGYVGTTIPVDQLRIQIFNTDPSVSGATPIFGNMTTNVLSAADSGEAMMYRIFNSFVIVPPAVAPTATGTTRKIWRVRGNITAALPAGTYWVVFQMHDTADTSGFVPGVTIVGSRGPVDANGKQNTITAGTPVWTNLIDAGNPGTLDDINQAIPFLINGTVLGVNENAFEASISLSPNPVRDMLSISVATGTVINSYEIFDVNGKVVKAMNSSASSITEINVSELSVGNYILKLQSDKGIASKKFIKE